MPAITFLVSQSVYDRFVPMGFDREFIDAWLKRGMDYFTHIWPNTVAQTTGRTASVTFHATTPTHPKLVNAWAWQSGRNLHLNPVPSNNPNARWSERAFVHAAAHEAGHYYLTRSHWDLPNYYGDGRFSHVLSLRGRDYMDAFSPYEHWHRRSWGVKSDQAWHPYVHTWHAQPLPQRTANIPLLLQIVRPYFQVGRRSNQRLHSPIGVKEIDDQLINLPFQSRPIIPQTA